jgi:N6-L-threonylcarbamoyladenine synthase
MSAECILGIETSCDETAAAVLDTHRRELGSCVRSQIDLHARFGGVVPEIAGRSHVEHMQAVLQEAMERAGVGFADLRAIAVTNTPGLVGSLLVGVSAAKSMALALGIPVIGVDHVHAHVYSCFHESEPLLPAAVLVASGGHCSLFEVRSLTDPILRGETIDDAPGEAFDKVAALLGLPYPGGPHIGKAALDGDPKAFRFPRSYLSKDSLDFSFSGLKTAVLYHCHGPRAQHPRTLGAKETADVAASFQEAVVDVLVKKLLRLAERIDACSIGLGGGVAANSRLREQLKAAAEKAKLPLALAPRSLTTDNAVMVAGLGALLLQQGRTDDLRLDAVPSGAASPR